MSKDIALAVERFIERRPTLEQTSPSVFWRAQERRQKVRKIAEVMKK